MAFKDLQEAEQYKIDTDKKMTELQQQLDNQKVVIDDKSKSIDEYKAEVNRLKSKNWELFEQISMVPPEEKSKSQNNPPMSYNEFLNKIL